MKNKNNIPTAIEDDIKKADSELKVVHNEELSELSKSIEVLQNPRRIETSTILSDAQVNGIVMMNWAGQVYDIQFFKEYVKSFPLFKISGGDGIGRKQSIEMAKAIQINNEDRDKRLGDILTGKR